jgi:hypothetical protein
MLQLLLALTIFVDLFAALAVFVWWARPDAIVAILLRPADVVTPRDVELTRRHVQRLKWPILLALGAWGFTCGAAVAVLRLMGVN